MDQQRAATLKTARTRASRPAHEPPVPFGAYNPDGSSTLTELIGARIKQDIVAGQLAPGEKLRIRELALRYDVGTSPIREALTRIVADGLVTAEGRRGFRVATISEADLQDLTRVRIVVETEALRLSIEHGDDAWEAAVVSAYHSLGKLEGGGTVSNFVEWEVRNWIFHRATIDACGSVRLLAMAEQLHHQHRRYRTLSHGSGPGARNVHAEHAAILEAVLARDTERACRAAADHIRSTAGKIRLSNRRPPLRTTAARTRTRSAVA
jgi:DNA-binding GntR family transcriptional regulator